MPSTVIARAIMLKRIDFLVAGATYLDCLYYSHYYVVDQT